MHLPKAVPNGGFPTLEPVGDLGSGFRIGLGQFTSDRADWAAAAAVEFPLVLDHPVAPGAQAVQAAEIERLLPGDDRVGLVLDHSANQRGLVIEVVVELRA